jgi:FdhD protein
MLSHERAQIWQWRGAGQEGEREVPAETAIAVVVNGGTHAVMMATPADLQDFAFGFALTEGLIGGRADIERFEIVEHDTGVEARLWLAEPLARSLTARRRAMAGPTGCGLCGIESLAEAVKPTRAVSSSLRMAQSEILYAMSQLHPAQKLNALTHAVHAAALWNADDGHLLVREDVGRHNALDKLVGAATAAVAKADRSALLLTSRVSVEMVQKAAVLGAPIVVAVSAPTNLAIRVAREAGITLCAVARDDGFEVFSHCGRITTGAS